MQCARALHPRLLAPWSSPKRQQFGMGARESQSVPGMGEDIYLLFIHCYLLALLFAQIHKTILEALTPTL